MTFEERNKILIDFDNYSEKKKNKLFKIIQVLLSSTFIVRGKDDASTRMYQLACWEKNYLRYVFEDMMGFRLLIQSEYGIIRLSCENEEDEDEAKTASTGSRLRLGFNASLLLMILFIVYDNSCRRQANNGIQYAKISDIKTEMEKANIDQYFTKMGFIGEIKSYLKLFKHHNLIDFKTADLDIKDENTEIRLFPSLMFAIKPEACLRFVEMYSNEKPAEDIEDEDDEIEDVEELFNDEESEGETNK